MDQRVVGCSGRTRYYDPQWTVGYTEADPLGLEAGWNRFVYVDGSPLDSVDPEGLEKVILFKGKSAEKEAARLVKDNPNVCIVYAHGAPGIISRTTEVAEEITIEELKNEIEKICKPRQPIQLMSCDGGTGGENSVAKKLFDAFGGTRPVSGYNGVVIYRAALFPFSANVYPSITSSNVAYK